MKRKSGEGGGADLRSRRGTRFNDSAFSCRDPLTVSRRFGLLLGLAGFMLVPLRRCIYRYRHIPTSALWTSGSRPSCHGPGATPPFRALSVLTRLLLHKR